MKKLIYILLLTAHVIAWSSDNDSKKNDLSILQTFAELYKNAKVIGMGIYAHNSGKAFDTVEEAQQVFNSACPNKNCDYVRGKLIKIDFAQHPNLDTTLYDRQYGEKAAKNILAKTKKNKTFDITESNACSVFSPDAIARMAPHLQKEFASTIKKCNEKSAAANIKITQQYVDCKANFAFVSEPCNYISHENMPCNEARTFMARIQKMDQQANKPGRTSIEDMHICDGKFIAGKPQQNCYSFPPLDISLAQEYINKISANK